MYTSSVTLRTANVRNEHIIRKEWKEGKERATTTQEENVPTIVALPCMCIIDAIDLTTVPAMFQRSLGERS